MITFWSHLIPKPKRSNPKIRIILTDTNRRIDPGFNRTKHGESCVVKFVMLLEELIIEPLAELIPALLRGV